MKEELRKVLNTKLTDINKNIASILEINSKIDDENEKLGYVNSLLVNFKEEETYDVLNFVKLTKEDFDKILDIVDIDVRNVFNTNNCSYDGLVYLINGINNGVSLSLTEEQKSSIEYLIRSIVKKQEEYKVAIDGLLLVKDGFTINDVDVLNKEKEKYEELINNLDKHQFISDTDRVCEAIEFSELNKLETIDLLSYLLEYNASVYKEGNNKEQFKVEETKEDTLSHEDFSFRPVSPINIEENENIETTEEVMDNTPADDSNEIETNQEINEVSTEDNDITFEAPIEENKEEVETEEFGGNNDEINVTPFAFEEYGEDNQDNNVSPYENETNEEIKENAEENNEELNIKAPVYYPEMNENQEVNEANSEQETNNDDMINIINPFEEENNNYYSENVENGINEYSDNNDYEEYQVSEEKTSNRELQRLFNEYELSDLEIDNELLQGNADNYKKVLEVLKRYDLLNKVKKNKELLREMMISSGEEEIEEILRIVKEELSVDEEDYEITLNIVLNTLPTVFIKDNGNYDNFVKNVQFFKIHGINLISLFDFSKEVLIADSQKLLNNYDTITKYNVELDYKNAKYLLMLDDIAEKMDYYVESKYLDKTKNEEFDGINYINNYAVKLNTVTDETIKRLRYASENNKKVLGSKPGSLTGEITNLKVNVLELDINYLSDFIDNELEGINASEMKEFVKLIRNSSNVGNYSDELDMLSKYHDGLRYNFDGILVSYNKVVRNYNILRSYGISNNKALQFAICYNLVITKDEYAKLKELINKVGGSF